MEINKGPFEELGGDVDLFYRLVLYGIIILLHVEWHVLKARRGSMYVLVLHHIQGFMVFLYDNMPAIEVCVELLKAEAHRQTLSINISVASFKIS